MQTPWDNIPWNKLKKGFSFFYDMQTLGMGHDVLEWEKSVRDIVRLGAENGVKVVAERRDWQNGFMFTVKSRMFAVEEWTDEEMKAFGVKSNYPRNKGLTKQLRDMPNDGHLIVPENKRYAAHALAKHLGFKISCASQGDGKIKITRKTT